MSQAHATADQLRSGRLPNLNKAVVVALLGLSAFVWATSVVRQYRNAARLEAFGAHIGYRHGNVVGIGFNNKGKPFGDEQLPLLGGLPCLEGLDLEHTRVTSSGLAHLQQLPRLREVSIRVDQLSAEEEEKLKTAMPHLVIMRFHFIDGMKVVDGWQ